MKLIRKNKFEPEESKLNLVPIMDAVFIFIFFLLFSAQFIKMYEIQSDAPIVREAPSNQVEDDKEVLNLKLKIKKRRYEIYTGKDERLAGKYLRGSKKESAKLKKKLLELRKKFPKEDFAIIVPEKLTSYDDIVKTIDLIQKLPAKVANFQIQKDGKKYLKTKIFTQVVLEPLE